LLLLLPLSETEIKLSGKAERAKARRRMKRFSMENVVG
jgi:hypothetical protein